MRRPLLSTILLLCIQSLLFGQDYYSGLLKVKDCPQSILVSNYKHPSKTQIDHDTTSFAENFCEYDDHCRIKRYSMSFGGFSAVYENIYDSTDRLTKTLTDNHSQIAFMYDEHHNLIRRSVADSGITRSTILYTYDANNNVSRECYYEDTTLSFCNLYLYNQKGHLAKRISVLENDTITEIIQYNQRNLISSKSVKSNTSMQTETYKYNRRGDPVIHDFHLQTKNEAEERERYKFRYTYDAHNNWVFCDVFLNSSFSNSIKRTITY
jgi:YD repeat-containing protein